MATKTAAVVSIFALYATVICGAFSPAPTTSRSQDGFALGVKASSDRRSFLTNGLGGALGSASLLLTSRAASAGDTKVLVLGGTGLVGSEVVKSLKSQGVDVVATSTNGRDGTIELDFTKGNVDSTIETLAKGCTAVISCVGAIGSAQDGVINSATGLAARGSKSAGVDKFVYVSVAPEVKKFAEGIDFLEDYMTGKTFSEDSVTSYFGEKGILIKPTFIYGGDSFGLTPPRVTTGYGKVIEAILASAPLRAATTIAPEGIIKIALEPPVASTAVANAAVASALGKATQTSLDTHDKINAAAAL
eukprot:CAMPEP_0194032306 /NCGR_PEP_ID=MMETSP0009_2-20130614/5282_1 /TAXON_ID=210454 /ORGANISM="Grammatophora oceanica, Strain CCMP 410" /LENGTH=303 /DNA_ID=CAMNT_0038672705 /DNA_START=13 /DNA_END=924 /DNA_ORIENTATION=+